MSTKPLTPVVKPEIYGNWSDTWGFPLAYKLVPLVIPFSFITPNIISITAFCLYTLGSLSLFIKYPYHLLISAILLPVSFVLDDMDGQVARAKKQASEIGNYLDKVLDVLKIFIITASLSYAVYIQTFDISSIYLGFTACFLFMYRYYIKLEGVMRQVEKDKEFLEKSRKVMDHISEERGQLYQKLSKSFSGILTKLWYQHRIIFFVDEAEFAIFTAIGALLNRLDITLYLLAVSQAIIVSWRLVERGYQAHTNSPDLYKFMRK
jgi:phosphatidylglycerophosphate synthase